MMILVGSTFEHEKSDFGQPKSLEKRNQGKKIYHGFEQFFNNFLCLSEPYINNISW